MSVSDASRAGRLASALDDVVHSSPDIVAAAVLSFDGLPIASVQPPEMPEDRLGAMSAALIALGEQALFSLGRGRLTQVFVEGEHGFVFLMTAEDQAVLAAVTTGDAKIGFMLYELRRTAAVVGAALRRSASVDAGRDHLPPPVGHPPPPGPAAPRRADAAQVPAPPPSGLAGSATERDGKTHDDVGVLLGEPGGRAWRNR